MSLRHKPQIPYQPFENADEGKQSGMRPKKKIKHSNSKASISLLCFLFCPQATLVRDIGVKVTA